MGEWKDEAIRTAREQADAQRVQDTLIAQKVGAAHRAAFREKFPGQVDHILRLIAERLQQGLRKDQEMPLSNDEVAHLAQSLHSVYLVHRDLEQE